MICRGTKTSLERSEHSGADLKMSETRKKEKGATRNYTELSYQRKVGKGNTNFLKPYNVKKYLRNGANSDNRSTEQIGRAHV